MRIFLRLHWNSSTSRQGWRKTAVLRLIQVAGERGGLCDPLIRWASGKDSAVRECGRIEAIALISEVPFEFRLLRDCEPCPFPLALERLPERAAFCPPH